MKRGTPEHPKIMDLAEAIHGFLGTAGIALPFELAHSLACGMFERLCHYAARYAPAGDIGKHSDLRIALAMGWKHEPTWIIETLITCKLIDRIDGEARLYVHDWHDHSDDAADKWLYDKGLGYTNGMPTRRGKHEREAAKNKRQSSSRPSRDTVTTQSRQSESKAKSKSSSESKSSSGPRPEPEADSLSPSPKDFSDDDTTQPPVDLSAIDWERVQYDVERIVRLAPPENRSHARTFARLAVMCQLNLGDGFIPDALGAMRANKSRAGPVKHFYGIIKGKAREESDLDLFPMLRRIYPIPQDVLEAIPIKEPIRG